MGEGDKIYVDVRKGGNNKDLVLGEGAENIVMRVNKISGLMLKKGKNTDIMFRYGHKILSEGRECKQNTGVVVEQG